ncbi:MAG: Flp pilus assembly complex ATPase component TadA, partial [Candidatus Omnitrophica bacterium]|nr:Flp pilus assembly complex ATPase component TadA [Candidatus Omnitrophota bacterium]
MMTEPDAQLNVQALAEAVSLVGSIGVPSEAAKDGAALMELASQAPVVRLVDVILLEAVNRRASDVHLEAFEQDVCVRYRIDGRCYLVARPPKSLAFAMTSRIKVLANLDVAESRLPQDGRILLSVNNRQIDLRVSTLPTLCGESVVLRVLDKGSLDKTL